MAARAALSAAVEELGARAVAAPAAPTARGLVEELVAMVGLLA